MKDFDVYAYGVIASSELHLLSMPFPSPDGYAGIAESHFMTGGGSPEFRNCPEPSGA